MIRYVSLGLVLVIMLLALISKKNFSKYKDSRPSNPKKISNPLWCLAVEITSRIGNKSGIRSYIRRIKPLNKNALDRETDKLIEKYVYDTLIIVVAFLFLISGLSFMPESSENPNIIQRPDIGDDKAYVNINLRDESADSEQKYQLEVNPREYTKEEFEEEVSKAKDYIESVILGKNADKSFITEDLVFPKHIEGTGLNVVWNTDLPTALGTDGKINRDELEKDTDVKITATIRDENYSDSYELAVRLIKDAGMTDSEKTKVAMLNIERENRSEKELVLPEYIGNVRVERDVETIEEKLLYMFFFGMLIIGVWMYYRIFKLKERAELRDTEIEDAYYGFTNRLAIYIGAGFTLQRSFKTAIRNEPCMSLVNEVEYTLNAISSGMSESKAYYELGSRLGTEEYMRLMSLISQNLSFGNSNLLKLLDAEIGNSFFMKKERTRKKGEQASEKLLIPTLILLVLVIVVVMYPAFIGMK